MKLLPILTVCVLLLPVLPPTDTAAEFTESIINQIDRSMLEYYLSTLVKFGNRYTGTEGCHRATAWAYEEFSAMGLTVTFQEWNTGGFSDRNVEATLYGDDNYTVIIGAHVDAVQGSPGADDNGSGVAAVLAIAQVLSQYRFTHTVKFLIYTGEEVGAYGSYNHARHVYEKGECVIGVYNLDMVGYAETERGGRNIRFFETERGSHLTDFCMTVSERYYDDIGLRIERVPNYPGSDHQAYLDYGYDAVFGAHYDGYPYGHS
jgi:acetylornithine deacetylase/succinyl-diaminopimelate desuccinylase-like protein